MRESLCHSRDDHVLASVVLAYHSQVLFHVNLFNRVKCMLSAKRIFIAALLSSSRCIVKYVTVRTCLEQIIDDDNDDDIN